MHYLKQDRGFYASTIALMLPMILQNLVVNFMQLADTFMVGALGETELAAVTMANSVFFVLQVVIFGIQSGTSVLIAQYHGRGDTGAINRVIGMGYYVSLTLTTVVAAVTCAFPVQVMQVITNNADLWAPGAEYSRIVGFSYIFMALGGIYIAAQRAMSNPRLGAAVLTVSGIVNIVLNYMFIFGKWGAPALGCAGAALATLISRGLEAAAVAVYASRSRSLPLNVKLILRPGRVIAKDFAKYSIPVILNEGLWSVGLSLYSVIMGHMPGSTPILAAYTISGNIDRMASVALFAAGNASAVVVGREIGCGADDVKSKGVALNFICLLTGFLSMGVTLLIRATLLDSLIFPLMGISAEAGRIAKFMLLAVAFLMPLRAMNLCNVVGVFRGGGDVNYALVCDIVPMYCACLPAAAVLALACGFGIEVIYLCMCADDVIKIFLCLPRLLSGKWVNNVTRELTE